MFVHLLLLGLDLGVDLGAQGQGLGARLEHVVHHHEDEYGKTIFVNGQKLKVKLIWLLFSHNFFRFRRLPVFRGLSATLPFECVVRYYYRTLENVEVNDKNVINKSKCKNAIKIANKLMGQNGRILVRKSGTEPKIRIMAESYDKSLILKCIKVIKSSIK